MASEDLAAAYGDATRLRAHELGWQLDGTLGNWMKDARDVLAKRGHLEFIREFLPVYYDPSRKAPVFGPGGKLASQATIERAIQPWLSARVTPEAQAGTRRSPARRRTRPGQSTPAIPGAASDNVASVVLTRAGWAGP